MLIFSRHAKYSNKTYNPSTLNVTSKHESEIIILKGPEIKSLTPSQAYDRTTKLSPVGISVILIYTAFVLPCMCIAYWQLVRACTSASAFRDRYIWFESVTGYNWSLGITTGYGK